MQMYSILIVTLWPNFSKSRAQDLVGSTIPHLKNTTCSAFPLKPGKSVP